MGRVQKEEEKGRGCEVDDEKRSRQIKKEKVKKEEEEAEEAAV